MNISFDPNNTNTIIFKINNKIVHYIALPPIENGCDLITNDYKFLKNYNYNFDGLVVITNKFKREIYQNGLLIASIKRN